MTNKDKQLKSLYQKYAHLEYPDLIRRAIQIEFDYTRRQIAKMRNNLYYENKKFFLSIKKELQRDIQNLRTVEQYMNIDYFTLNRSYEVQSRMEALMEINEKIWMLDKQHEFYKMGEY